MNLVELLEERGFIDSLTNKEALESLCETPQKVYIGFDPTASSLHLGNLVGIIAMSWFQRYGHTAVAVLGGATGKIGDPSGKSVERPLLTYEELQYNVEEIRKQFERTLDPQHLEIMNNDTWLSSLNLIDFLRDIGKHFRMGPMLAKDSVKTRIGSEEGMSFTEFTYQIMQGYDFYHLSQEHGVHIQLGGSDQWGNITAGIELTRKLVQKEVYGVTFPLLTRSDGKKFGKSEGGAIWLCPSQCSPYAFYQYLFRIPDADIIRMLKMLTFLSIEEIKGYEAQLSNGELAPNTLQRLLAQEVTRFVHGESGVTSAEKVTAALAPGSKAELDGEVIENILGEIPHATLPREAVEGRTYAEIASASGLFQSKSEAVRMIKNGGAYVNNKKIEDVTTPIEASSFIDGLYLLVGAGKKKKQIIKIG